MQSEFIKSILTLIDFNLFSLNFKIFIYIFFFYYSIIQELLYKLHIYIYTYLYLISIYQVSVFKNRLDASQFIMDEDPKSRMDEEDKIIATTKNLYKIID